MAASSSYNLQVKEQHVDSYGHMNNATYLVLFEEARWEHITARGFGFSDIHRAQKGPVILEVNLKFMKELKLRENITITTEMLSYKGKIGQLKQTMLNSKGELACEALFTVGLFDIAQRKLIEPTPEWKKAVGLED